MGRARGVTVAAGAAATLDKHAPAASQWRTFMLLIWARRLSLGFFVAFAVGAPRAGPQAVYGRGSQDFVRSQPDSGGRADRSLVRPRTVTGLPSP